jgi:hypothetical protein
MFTFGCLWIAFLLIYLFLGNKLICKVRRLGGKNGQFRHNKASNAELGNDILQNKITGTQTSFFHQFSDILQNKITGTQTSFFHQFLDISQNKITGTQTSFFHQFLDISQNKITGTQTSFFHQFLDISQNKITGTQTSFFHQIFGSKTEFHPLFPFPWAPPLTDATYIHFHFSYLYNYYN